MCPTYVHLLILMTPFCLSWAENPTEAVNCPEHQRTFRGSCYEFVSLQHSFFGAQAWCEQRGGNLAFIPDKETQYFLQRHFDPQKDMWLGAASSASANLQDSPTVEGPLSWLDGSHVTYSNWVSSPQPGEACGHILKNSGFQWETTRDCSKKLPFICQFESGRSIICAARDATLQCDSGQVLMIEGGFYGRKNIHYCRSAGSPPTTPTQPQCSWVDVVESIKAHCYGRQVCQITEILDSFDDPCPQLGSYLSVDYHCKDGITLSVSAVAAVFNDVTITFKQLLLLPQGNLICKLSTGDGHVMYLHGPEGSKKSVVHKYSHPGTFVVAVECTNSTIHITAQKIIAVQQPIRVFGVVTCFAGKLSFQATNCKALYGETFQIQMEVKAGTNVTYRIQRDEMLLSGLSVVRGNIPQNITVTSETVKQLGTGCHQLTLYATNMVTFPEFYAELQMCVLEKVAGLQASVFTEKDGCLDSPIINVGVSLERGVPVLLLFSVTEGNVSFSVTRELKTRKDVFHFGRQIQGSGQVKLRAWNVFSSAEVNVDMSASCAKDSLVLARKKHIRVARSLLRINANPSAVVTTKQVITLSVNTTSALNDPNKRYQWECPNPCKCQGEFEGLTYIITKDCLPDPFTFFEYTFKVINRANNDVEERESICISVTAVKADLSPRLSCTSGCEPVKENKDAKIEMSCEGLPCPDVVWYTLDPRDYEDWRSEPKRCYRDAGRSPLEREQNGGTKYTVRSNVLERGKSLGRDITVMIIFGDNTPQYVSFIINTSTENSSPSTTSGTTIATLITTTTAATTATTATTSTTPTTATTATTATTTSSANTPTTATTATTAPTTSSANTPNTATTVTTAPTASSATTTTTVTTATTATTTTSATMATTATTGTSMTTSAFSTTFTITVPAMAMTTATTSDTSSPKTTKNFDSLKCSISPKSGTILDAFKITCTTETPCSECQYCFKLNEEKHLLCSENNQVQSIFLPLGDRSLNYSLIIKATAKNKIFVASTTLTTQVLDSTTNSSVDHLKAAVENTVAQLEENSLLSGQNVGQFFNSVANKLNNETDDLNKADRQELREQMLNIMISAVNKVPTKNPEEVQVIARGLSAVIQKGTELSSSAQEEASLFLTNLSSSLLNMEMNNSKEVHAASSTIVEGASNILDYSSNKNVSDALLAVLTNTQSALLKLANANAGSATIQQGLISVFVSRVTPSNLHTKSINIPNCSCSSFSLPKLPTDIFPSEEPVDVRMMSLGKNPFSWNERGNISGEVGALSLSTKEGSNIPLENLSEDVEVLLPRPVGEQVSISFLDLGNYSTTVIDLSSADMTLVLKMKPSNDPLPFKVFLGYKDYPTDENYVAMTEMPHQGETQEERYTWVIEPEILKGNTGVHYLVVRPIVGPGIKSINGSLSITSITTSCKFWNETKSDWSNNGCRVGVRTTHLVTQCLCNHLTFFGSSFFVTPNLVDPSRTAELFATFAENPVVVCFVGALFVAYLLVVVWARRKDIQDAAKVKVTVLEDNNPMDEYRYLMSVSTGHRRGASTSSQVTITLLGVDGNSEPHHLSDPKKGVFERGAVDLFLLTAPFSLGDLQGVRLWHNNLGSHPAWYVGNVMVQDLQTDQKWHFLCNSWLAIDMGDSSLDKVFPVSTEMDLKRFSNLFFMKTSKDFSDGHLWYSVISRPPSSNFTCVQRVSCCFSLLLCTMLTSIMFYGIPADPSEQTMDLGHFEFTWQQFMIGVQSSLIMFPINILIVTIFRNTRPRETSCRRRKTAKTDVLEQTSSSQTAVTDETVTLATVIKDITRIAHSLSKTVKSNIPCKESDFGFRQQPDVIAALSVVEDVIKQNNKTFESSQSKAQSFHSNTEPQSPVGSASMHPESTVEGTEKKSNKAQYLYWQLCHIDRKLSQLGPSNFPTPHSYSQALQQVEGMKKLLEDQLFSCVSLEEQTQKLSQADSTNGDDSKKKRLCCHGGLPWWFIFFGWLLVIASSVVAGYFTMLYGLRFGRERSINWLVSMIVSFFQSILVIQPLKVICLAVFFALVIKKVDEEDYQNVEFVRNDRNRGDCEDQHTVRQDCSLYEPPPPARIEKMKREKALEQKAFALIREILTYVGFMSMLLLIAYGQRDPNAFFLNRHIRNSFSESTSDSMSLGDVFTWANTSLLSNLFGVYPGFITDGNSKLVRNARLRQLRVQKNSCQIDRSMLQFLPDCHAPYSWEVEDMGSYNPGWNHSVRDNISTSTSSPWRYQTQAQLRAHPVWGKMVLYRGGGFVAELGPDLQNASSTLEHLFKNKWLDEYTRAILVEFTVYNANVNLFCIVTLMFETSAIGAFQFNSGLQSIRLYRSPGGLYIFVLAAEIIYLLFILYYMFVQGKLLKQQRSAYFRNKWNLLDITIILLSWSAVAVFIMRTVLGNRDMNYYQNHKDQFASFYETATADSLLQYLIAFLVLLATIKLWHLLRLNPKMNMITATLQRAWSDISGFLVIIVVMLVAYSIACNMIYGWRMSSYRTFANALITIISLQMGIFNYEEVLSSTPLLGGFLIGSCIVFMSFVVLNLLVSVILMAFNQEQIYHKPSDEEEIVDLMLKKISSFFGIRYRNTKDTAGSDVNGESGLTLNNSRNIINDSSIDVNIFQASDKSVNP